MINDRILRFRLNNLQLSHPICGTKFKPLYDEAPGTVTVPSGFTTAVTEATKSDNMVNIFEELKSTRRFELWDKTDERTARLYAVNNAPLVPALRSRFRF